MQHNFNYTIKQSLKLHIQITDLFLNDESVKVIVSYANNFNTYQGISESLQHLLKVKDFENLYSFKIWHGCRVKTSE